MVYKYFTTLFNSIKKTLRDQGFFYAIVKMNLSNKEIAPLLNISVRGVETARYRVRKRLKVQETNFIVFLESLSEPVPKE
jgi:FixJ family two-component response regulator